MKNGKKLYNERGITFFHETERYVNNLNIYNRSKNGTNLWDDLIESPIYKIMVQPTGRCMILSFDYLKCEEHLYVDLINLLKAIGSLVF